MQFNASYHRFKIFEVDIEIFVNKARKVITHSGLDHVSVKCKFCCFLSGHILIKYVKEKIGNIINSVVTFIHPGKCSFPWEQYFCNLDCYLRLNIDCLKNKYFHCKLNVICWEWTIKFNNIIEMQLPNPSEPRTPIVQNF